MASTNTISTHDYRQKYRLAKMDKKLRKLLIAESVFMVDRSGLKTIESPYGSQPTTTIQTIRGTYSSDVYTTTEDQLSVDEEFICSNHVHDYNMTLTKFDAFAARTDELIYSVAAAIDKFVINEILSQANGSYSTPAGGFTTPANVQVILSNLSSKVMGYADFYNGLFLIIENTDVPGFMQSAAASGFTFSDKALNNGWMTSYMGIDIYVARTGLFVTASQGGNSFTNAGHRLFGVKNVATYAAPQGIKIEEKAIAGNTGKEIVVYGYIGAKAWVTKYDLLIDILIV